MQLLYPMCPAKNVSKNQISHLQVRGVSVAVKLTRELHTRTAQIIRKEEILQGKKW